METERYEKLQLAKDSPWPGFSPVSISHIMSSAVTSELKSIHLPVVTNSAYISYTKHRHVRHTCPNSLWETAFSILFAIEYPQCTLIQSVQVLDFTITYNAISSWAEKISANCLYAQYIHLCSHISIFFTFIHHLINKGQTVQHKVVFHLLGFCYAVSRVFWVVARSNF